jgi:ubiquinone/menaquinone biosynthesis C-methylase UbiE
MTTTKSHGQFWDRVTEQAQPIAEALHLIQALIPADTIKDHAILDAGCGAGDYSAAFTQLGARTVSGLDVSVGSLQLASAQTPSGKFLQASLSELPYASASFDAIWSWGVLHYVPHPQAALREVVRVLRPGGVAIIHTIKASFWANFERTSAKFLSSAPGWVEPLVISTGERIIPILTRLATGRPPEAQTSKTVRQKLHERLFVPGHTHMFTLDELLKPINTTAHVTEVHPPVSNLLNRDMTITIMIRKRP